MGLLQLTLFLIIALLGFSLHKKALQPRIYAPFHSKIFIYCWLGAIVLKEPVIDWPNILIWSIVW